MSRVTASISVTDAVEDRGRGHPVGTTYLGDGVQGGIVPAPLHARIEGAVQAGALGHLLLAQPRGFAQGLEPYAERGKECGLVHDHRNAARGVEDATSSRNTIVRHDVDTPYAMITATMLYDVATCEHRVHLDLYGDASRREPVSAFVEMLWREGARHEEAMLADVPSGTVDLRLATGDRRRLTETAIGDHAPLILGGEISVAGLLARPDLLRREATGYVPGDVKAGAATSGSAGKLKNAYTNQVALAADVLQRQGRLADRRGFILDRSGAEIRFALDAPLGARGDATPWSVYRGALAIVSDIVTGSVATRPAAAAACKLCRWRGHCREELIASDDVTLVPLLGRALRTSLAPKVRTVAQLAAIDLERSMRPAGRTEFAGIGAERLARFRDRARLLTDPTQGAYAREPLPLARAARELFFDIEVDPFTDTTYLHGIVERTSENGTKTERFSAHLMANASAAEEERAFAAAMAQLTADPDAMIYYWSKYERTMYRALQARYPGVCSREEVDALFASPKVIDLLGDVVSPKTDWPLHDHSIKTIAKYCSFSWRDAEPSGAASIEWYRRWLATGDDAIRTRILEYNEDDCLATRAVLDGLLRLPVRSAEQRA